MNRWLPVQRPEQRRLFRESLWLRPKDRLPMLVATIPATLALCGTLSLGAVQLVTHESGRPVQTCSALVERIGDLAEKHPTLAEIYTVHKGPGLPRLADAEEIRRCGDPLDLLRELAKARAAP